MSDLSSWLERFLGAPEATGPAPVSRARDAEPRPGVCSLCSCNCGLEAWVRDGELQHLEGDPSSPINQGTLCARGVAAAGLHRHPGRLLRPRVRRPGSDFWEEASWSEALPAIAQGLYLLRDEHWEGSTGRSDSLAFLGGPDLTNEEAYLFRKLATLLGVVGVESPARDAAAAAVRGLEATFGVGAGSEPIEDLAASRLILAYGANPAESHPMSMRWILEARSRGARLVVVDPRFTRTASHADEFVALRPGSDLALVGALIKQVVERGYLDRDYLRERTNALCLVHPDYSFEGGLFSGLKRKGDGTREYDTGSWRYLVDEGGAPRRGGELEEEGTVFWHLCRHFARYDLKTAEGITGIRAEQIERLAELLGSIRPAALVLGGGVTGHVVGVQLVRALGILQLLLGNVGSEGGGVHQTAGEGNAQGALDCGLLWDSLPGGVPLPGQWDGTLDEYRRSLGDEAHLGMVNLLRAWFGTETGLAEAYALMPRLPRSAGFSLHELWDRMREGTIRALVALGANPAVTSAAREQTLRSLACLDLLVVSDVFDSETASFWRLFEDPTEVQTEVWQLPAATFLERGGSLTSSARRIRAREAALPLPGESRPDLWTLDGLFHELRALAAEKRRPRDRALAGASWRYGDPLGLPGDQGYREVRAEMAGRALSDISLEDGDLLEGQALPSGSYLLADGRTACGCRLHAGLFAGGVDRALEAGSGGWYWPDGRARLHEHGDFPETVEGAARLFAAGHPSAPGEPVTRRIEPPLDGPLPEHYEPGEGPFANLLHPGQPCSPVVLHPRTEDGSPLGDPADFPHVLTTGSLHEMWGGGTISRNLAPLVEAQPAPFVEISRSLANRIGVAGGDMVRLSTARGQVELPVLVTGRVRALYCGDHFVEVLWVPTAWGEVGESRAAGLHTLTLDALEPNVMSAGSRASRCRIERVGGAEP